jgi:hypothetical protein
MLSVSNGWYTMQTISQVCFFLFHIEKGPAADVTDAPQPEGLLCNPCERSDIDKALLNWYTQQRSDGVPVSSPILVITFVLPKF